jgi:hypothetical protein
MKKSIILLGLLSILGIQSAFAPGKKFDLYAFLTKAIEASEGGFSTIQGNKLSENVNGSIYSCKLSIENSKVVIAEQSETKAKRLQANWVYEASSEQDLDKIYCEMVLTQFKLYPTKNLFPCRIIEEQGIIGLSDKEYTLYTKESTTDDKAVANLSYMTSEDGIIAIISVYDAKNWK